MAFEGTPEAGTAAEPRYPGTGFRNEPDFRDGTTPTSFQTVSAPAAGADSEATLTLNSRRLPPPNLDYVFDDPADGEPGRDRMLVHGVWELILAVALIGVGYLLSREETGSLSGEGLRSLLVYASMLGALAVGSALSLRAGAPNLAVGAVAIAAALYFGHNADGGLFQPVAVVVGVCAVIGLVQGLVIVGLHVPGWAASIGVGLVLLIWSSRQASVSIADGYNPLDHAYVWFGAIAAVSVISGLVGLVPSVRRAVGRFRPVADPAQRRGMVAAAITLGAVVGSTVLAGIAGVLAIGLARQAAPSDGFELTALALGAALLGGTSAFGRRGGIFGTVFAACLLTVAMAYAEAAGQNWSPAAFAAAAIALGLAVTRLVERYGRPTPGDELDDEDWVPGTTSTDGWSAGRPSTDLGGLWSSDEAWGAGERR